MIIRTIGSDDVDPFVHLRKASLLDAPEALTASPEDDLFRSPDAVRDLIARAPESVIFGAFENGLTGTVGIYRARHLKCSYKAHVWGMYVVPEMRGRGVGRSLMEAAIAHARALPGVETVHLGVSHTAPDAIRLYERLGFVTWGTEPDALRVGGVSIDEHHMILRL